MSGPVQDEQEVMDGTHTGRVTNVTSIVCLDGQFKFKVYSLFTKESHSYRDYDVLCKLLILFYK